jgi:hypothetical protein
MLPYLEEIANNFDAHTKDKSILCEKNWVGSKFFRVKRKNLAEHSRLKKRKILA